MKLERRSDATDLSQLKNRIFGSSIDLIDGINDSHTAEHYSLQWGAAVGFQDFARRNPNAMEFTPSRQLGWIALFEHIRARAREMPTRVYDAACGFGGIMDQLFHDPVPEHLLYVGADIHGAPGDIQVPKKARVDQILLFRFDISSPLPPLPSQLEAFEVAVVLVSMLAISGGRQRFHLRLLWHLVVLFPTSLLGALCLMSNGRSFVRFYAS